jgi:hypothetical protein
VEQSDYCQFQKVLRIVRYKAPLPVNKQINLKNTKRYLYLLDLKIVPVKLTYQLGYA